MRHTSQFDKLKSGAEKYSADPQDGAPPEEDLDLSIFDELDVLLDEEKSLRRRKPIMTPLSVRTPRNFLQKQKTSAPDAEGAGKAAEGADEPVGRKNSPGKADSDGLEEEPGGKRADAADTPSAGAEPAGEDSGTSGGSSSNSGEKPLRPCCGFAEQRLDRPGRSSSFEPRYSKTDR